MKLLGVTILQGVEFGIFLLIFAWALQQCSATALPVINSNWHPISYRFEVIADCCLNFGHFASSKVRFCTKNGRFAFSSSPLGLRDNVPCSSWAHWKARSGLVLIGLFARCYGWGATTYNLADTDSPPCKTPIFNLCRLKIGVLQGGESVSAKFSHSRGRPPPIIFARIDSPMNALQLCRWKFLHKETL